MTFFKEKMRLGAMASAIAAVVASPLAVAEDAFTGFYVGGAIGIFSDVTADTEWPNGWSAKFGVQDTLYTRLDVRAGYGHVLGNNIYLGAELSYTLHDNLDDTVERWTDGEFEVAIGDGYALKAQLGYAVSSNVLLYGTVGYQSRNIEVKYRDSLFSGKGDKDFDGFGYGFGLRYAFTENLMLTAEVFHVDYSSENAFDVKIDPAETQFDMGLVFKF